MFRDGAIPGFREQGWCRALCAVVGYELDSMYTPELRVLLNKPKVVLGEYGPWRVIHAPLPRFEGRSNADV